MADAAADQLKDNLTIDGPAATAGDQATPSAEVNMEGIRAPYSNRVVIKTIVGAPDGGLSLVGRVIIVGGWVKTGREQGKGTFAFLELNDGSCPANLQVGWSLIVSSRVRSRWVCWRTSWRKVRWYGMTGKGTKNGSTT